MVCLDCLLDLSDEHMNTILANKYARDLCESVSHDGYGLLYQPQIVGSLEDGILDLVGKGLTEVPKIIAGMEGLLHLSLRKNYICWVENIQWPSTLRSLDLSDNRLGTWPTGLPKDLEELKLDDNPLMTCLPPADYEYPASFSIQGCLVNRIFTVPKGMRQIGQGVYSKK